LVLSHDQDSLGRGEEKEGISLQKHDAGKVQEFNQLLSTPSLPKVKVWPGSKCSKREWVTLCEDLQSSCTWEWITEEGNENVFSSHVA
jgi:hypothetical protein